MVPCPASHHLGLGDCSFLVHPRLQCSLIRLQTHAVHLGLKRWCRVVAFGFLILGYCFLALKGQNLLVLGALIIPTLTGWSLKTIFPQQRKLKGSSAQISSGVFRCGSQEQVPEAGSGEFRCVAGVGSGRFRKVSESSGVCWCRFRGRLQVPEGSGRFRRVLVCAGVGSGGRLRKVPDSSDVCWCRFGE